jgi:hypothetical protein
MIEMPSEAPHRGTRVAEPVGVHVGGGLEESGAPTFVKSLNELLRRDRAESLFAEERDLIPVDGAVKSNSEPAPSPDIRWPEG